MVHKRELHDRQVTSVTTERHGRRASPHSPLGALYRKEAHRLRRRYPALDDDRRDWIVLRSLARAFLDVDAAELAQAMVEGSPGLVKRKAGHTEVYVSFVVHDALTVARQDDTLPRRP